MKLILNTNSRTMINQETLKNGFQQLMADTKVQMESIQNDIRLIPETLEQLAENSQVLMGQTRMQIEAMTDKIMDGTFFQKEYKTQIQHTVTELQTAVVKMLDSIKNAIEKAR